LVFIALCSVVMVLFSLLNNRVWRGGVRSGKVWALSVREDGGLVINLLEPLGGPARYILGLGPPPWPAPIDTAQNSFCIIHIKSLIIGAPKGTRTPVFAVRGRRPRPLDDGSNRSRGASPTIYIGAGKSGKSSTWRTNSVRRRLAVRVVLSL
jgi:hypothetical protein